MIVRELLTRLGFKTDTASLNRAEQGINKVKDGAERAAGALRNAALALGGFAAVQGVVRLADEMQSMRSRIEGLPQTIGDAGAAFDIVADRAAAAGMSIDAYGRLYTRVGMAAQDYIKTQEDLLGITDTIGKALVVGGANAQEASATMIQFSQALASGVLQGDEFRSMAEAAPQYLEQLSLAMNIPRENLKKMASDGKLTAKAVIEATRQMSGYFESRFAKMPMTVGRATNVISVRFAKMIDKMNRESGAITSAANVIVSAMDKVEAAIGFVIDKLGGMERATRLVGIAIGVAFGMKTLQILAAFRTASLAALWPYIRMVAILVAVTLALEDLYVWMQGGESVIGSAIGPWTEYSGIVQATMDFVKQFGPALLELAKFVGVTVAIFKVATFVMAAFNAVLALTPIGWILIGIAALAAAGIALYQNWDTVKKWFADFFNWLGGKFTWLLDKIRGLGSIAAMIPGLNVVTGGIAAYDAMNKPAKMAGPAMGRGGATNNVNTTVNMTVPPGSTKEQQAAVKRTAEAAFAPRGNGLARDLSARGR